MSAHARELYIGLISGTSMDGIDAAAVELGDRRCRVLHALTTPYASGLREALLRAVGAPERCGLDEFGDLDHRVGAALRDAAKALLAASGLDARDVRAIGSHGQTLRHRPRATHPFTLQIGDPHLIAAGTGITTVADFRRRDLAVGGEGAPLAPAFHHWLFAERKISRVVLNVGGFANVTVLPAGSDKVVGFDTGPGNSLLDAWCRRHCGRPYDAGGSWAARGTVDTTLLDRLLDDPYFASEPPKSTGFEYFDAAWLDDKLRRQAALAPADVQATLCELSARTIADAIARHAPDAAEVLICGGGAHNRLLCARLEAALPGAVLKSTASLGIGPDWVEAAAFAWLAARCLGGQPGNLPAVTGAREATILGAVFPASR